MFFKCANKLAPNILTDSRDISTRGATTQNSIVPKRKTKFAQSTLSLKGTLLWNSLPVDLKIQTELKIFLKKRNKYKENGFVNIIGCTLVSAKDVTHTK